MSSRHKAETPLVETPVLEAEKPEVSAKEPEEKKAEPETTTDQVNTDSHYSNLHERLNAALRNFREAGENISAILVENIRFNRDKLAEYVDKLEELTEALPPIDDLRKFLEGIDSIRAEVTKIKEKSDSEVATKVEAIERTLQQLTGELVDMRKKNEEREAESPSSHLIAANTDEINMLKGQLIDLNNRFAVFFEQLGLVNQTASNDRQNYVTLQGRYNELNNRLTELLSRVLALEERRAQ